MSTDRRKGERRKHGSIPYMPLQGCLICAPKSIERRRESDRRKAPQNINPATRCALCDAGINHEPHGWPKALAEREGKAK